MTSWWIILKQLAMLSTALLICGVTSSAAGQEPGPSLETTNAEWIRGKDCWCIKDQDLAKAASALKFAKVQLTLKDEEMQKRLELSTQGCDMKLGMTRDACAAQVDMVKASCATQVEYMLKQTETMVSSLTEAHAEQLKATTELLKPPKTEWYRHPLFVSALAGTAGIGIGILAGTLVYR